MNDTASYIKISKFELWIIRGFGVVLMAMMSWIGAQFHTALIHIAEIRKELEIVRPTDILTAVTDLERNTLTRQDVASIVKETAPWSLEQSQWREWRAAVDARLLTDSSWTRSDMRNWIHLLERALRKAGVDVHLPGAE